MLHICRRPALTNTSTSAVGEINSGDDLREATTMEDEEYTDSSSVSSGSGDAIVVEPCIPMSEDEVMQIR